MMKMMRMNGQSNSRHSSLKSSLIGLVWIASWGCSLTENCTSAIVSYIKYQINLPLLYFTHSTGKCTEMKFMLVIIGA